jgi:hypothetical protein
MPDATVTLRVYTGSGAGTESAAQVGIDLVSIDTAANTALDRSSHPVIAGTNSFEKWIRLKVGSANSHTLTDFWVERSGDLPDGAVVKMGVTDTPVTPVATPSTVATTTMVDGRRYIFDVNEYVADGDATRYLVLQEQVANTVPAGSIETQSFEIGWSQS